VSVAEGTRSVLKPDLAGREGFLPLGLLLAAGCCRCCSLLVACRFRLLGSQDHSLPAQSGMGIIEDGKRVFKQLGVRVDELRRAEGRSELGKMVKVIKRELLGQGRRKYHTEETNTDTVDRLDS